MNETSVETDDTPMVGIPSLWEENHGNLLLGFVVIVFVVGASIMAYRQVRFVPPRFPDSASIRDPRLAVDAATLDEDEPSITIDVLGAANDSGVMKIAIFESQEKLNQPDQATFLRSVNTTDGQVSLAVALKLLPKRFVVSAYHDENDDGILNLNRFEIPVERYGFSRNARGLMGPPSFESAVIERPKAGEKIVVFVR